MAKRAKLQRFIQFIPRRSLNEDRVELGARISEPRGENRLRLPIAGANAKGGSTESLNILKKQKNGR